MHSSLIRLERENERLQDCQVSNRLNLRAIQDFKLETRSTDDASNVVGFKVVR